MHVSNFVLRSSLLALIVACSSPPSTATTVREPIPETEPDAAVEPEKDGIDKDVVAVDGEPMVLPMSGPTPEWFEAALDGEPKRATYTATTIASGQTPPLLLNPFPNRRCMQVRHSLQGHQPMCPSAPENRPDWGSWRSRRG